MKKEKLNILKTEIKCELKTYVLLALILSKFRFEFKMKVEEEILDLKISRQNKNSSFFDNDISTNDDIFSFFKIDISLSMNL